MTRTAKTIWISIKMIAAVPDIVIKVLAQGARILSPFMLICLINIVPMKSATSPSPNQMISFHSKFFLRASPITPIE